MNLVIENAILIENKVYFFVRGIRLLLFYDLISKKVEILSMLPVGSPFDLTDGIKMFFWHESIVFTPMGTNEIWIYDIKIRDWKSYEIPHYDIVGLDVQLFVSEIYGDSIFMAGCHTGDIIRCDLQNGLFEYKKIRNNITIEEIPLFDRFRYHVNSGHMIIPRLEKNVEIDICMINKGLEFALYEKKMDDKSEYAGIYVENNKRFCRKNGYTLTIYENGGIDIETDKNIYEVEAACIKEALYSYMRDEKLLPLYPVQENDACTLSDFINLL